MKFCLVGYGAIAEKHMEALTAIEGVEPHVLVGRRQKPASQFAAKWKFNRCTLKLDEALAEPDVEAVVITSPNAVHAEQAEKALKAGKHVLVEIPMALNCNDAERVTRLSRQLNKRLMVAHTMRFFPAIQEIRNRVMSGTLNIHHITGFFGNVRRTNISANGTQRSWTDNILWHHGAHMVDVALWILGQSEASAMHCQFGPPHPAQGIMDFSMALRLPGGQLFTLSESYYSSRLRWQMTFICEEGTFDFDTGTLYDADGKIIVPHHPVNDLHAQDREFIDSIRKGRDPAVTGEDVLPAMRILQMAQTSAAGKAATSQNLSEP